MNCEIFKIIFFIISHTSSADTGKPYSQNSLGRRISNNLDKRYAGGMKKHPVYEGYARPITHGVWHGTAGAVKWVGNKFGQKNDYKKEFKRAGEQFDRVGKGRPNQDNRHD